MGAQKLGQPVPESNLVSDVNKGAPQPKQWYVPGSLVFQYLPVKARSVPAWRVTWYCSGVNCACHSASLFEILGVFAATLFAMKNALSSRENEFSSLDVRNAWKSQIEFLAQVGPD